MGRFGAELEEAMELWDWTEAGCVVGTPLAVTLKTLCAELACGESSEFPVGYTGEVVLWCGFLTCCGTKTYVPGGQ